MALYGVGLDVTVKRIHSDLKLHLAKKQGGLGLKQLKEVFTMMDRNGNGSIEFPELEMALSHIGFFLCLLFIYFFYSLFFFVFLI